MLALGCLFLVHSAFAATLQIQITPTVSGENLQPASFRYQTSAGETFSITRVSYLVSDFELQRDDGSWLMISNSVAWMDFEANRDSMRVEIPSGEYRSIRYLVGLNTNLNHADPAKFPPAHPLNPDLDNLNWSWQGGYIFLALEGLWRNAGGEMDGWAYHLARDTNAVRITLATPLDITNETKVELDFDLATVLNAPQPLSFARDGSSTHSRDGDPIAAALKKNLVGAFSVRRVSNLTDAEIAVAHPKPLYLPAKFTPYEFKMNATFPIPDLPPDNPLTVERVELGKKLFFEKRISINDQQSCADCHLPQNAFADGRKTARGAEGVFGPRNTMPLVNLAWKREFFWDGRANSLREQVLQPVTNAIEMHQPLTNLVMKLAAIGRAGSPLPAASCNGRAPVYHDGAHGVTRPTSPVISMDCGEYPAYATTAFLNLPVSQDATANAPASWTAPVLWRFSIANLARQNLSEASQSRIPRTAGLTASDHAEESASDDYPALFTAAFGSPEITAEKISLALENYLLTLTSFDSKFDRVLRGAEKFTADEQRGFELFSTEYDPRRGQFGADCFHCHGGTLFQSQAFANNGLDANFTDSGRKKVTGKISDEGKFSVPSLRNIALTAPYMHDGRFRTLEEVVEHYSTGVVRSATLDPNLAKHPDGGVPLTDADKKALVAFLKTLTDAQFTVAAQN
jgi:cytochrome c peroxidase